MEALARLFRYAGFSVNMGGLRGGTGGLEPLPPGKSQVAISFLRNNGTDPPQEASQGRSVRPSVKYVDEE